MPCPDPLRTGPGKRERKGNAADTARVLTTSQNLPMASYEARIHPQNRTTWKGRRSEAGHVRAKGQLAAKAWGRGEGSKAMVGMNVEIKGQAHGACTQ